MHTGPSPALKYTQSSSSPLSGEIPALVKVMWSQRRAVTSSTEDSQYCSYLPNPRPWQIPCANPTKTNKKAGFQKAEYLQNPRKQWLSLFHQHFAMSNILRVGVIFSQQAGCSISGNTSSSDMCFLPRSGTSANALDLRADEWHELPSFYPPNPEWKRTKASFLVILPALVASQDRCRIYIYTVLELH